jgi:hypothetical protein
MNSFMRLHVHCVTIKLSPVLQLGIQSNKKIRILFLSKVDKQTKNYIPWLQISSSVQNMENIVKY